MCLRFVTEYCVCVFSLANGLFSILYSASVVEYECEHFFISFLLSVCGVFFFSFFFHKLLRFDYSSRCIVFIFIIDSQNESFGCFCCVTCCLRAHTQAQRRTHAHDLVC